MIGSDSVGFAAVFCRLIQGYVALVCVLVLSTVVFPASSCENSARFRTGVEQKVKFLDK